MISLLAINATCALASVPTEMSTREEKMIWCYMAQWPGKVDIHECESLSSSCLEASFWPQNDLRSNLGAYKFHTPDPPSYCVISQAKPFSFHSTDCFHISTVGLACETGCCVLTHMLVIWALQIWWLWPCKYSAVHGESQSLLIKLLPT